MLLVNILNKIPHGNPDRLVLINYRAVCRADSHINMNIYRYLKYYLKFLILADRLVLAGKILNIYEYYLNFFRHLLSIFLQYDLHILLKNPVLLSVRIIIFYDLLKSCQVSSC